MTFLKLPQRTRQFRPRKNDRLCWAHRQLAFETMEERTLLTTFTVNVLDQFGSEIAGSAINVPGVGLVATGSTVTLADGDHAFSVIPKVIDTDPLTGGGGLLSRAESRTVSASTTAVDFVWPVQQVQLNLVDQFGDPIVGLSGQPSSFYFSNSSQPIANTSMVALPITDESLLPGSLGGIWADGYDLYMLPAILDTNLLGGGVNGVLNRLEVSATTEVSTSTSALTFEWAVQQVQLNLVDQFGDPIVGTVGQPSSFIFSNSSHHIANASTVALPITDESLLPGSVGGIWADGYDLYMKPAILDTNLLGSGGGVLNRLEVSATTEVSTSTSALTFEWATVSGPLRVVDENELEIDGSEYNLFNSGLVLATGSHVVLPITDDSALPGTLGGQFANGYDVRIRLPGSPTFSGPFDFELAADRKFSPLFVSIDAGSVGLRFLPDVQPVEIDVKPGSDLNPINLIENGVVAVAVFTTEAFNASTIDVSTVVFAGASAVQSALEDVDGDGDLDLVLHFRIQDTELDEIYAQLVADDINADGVLDSNKQGFEVTLTGLTLDDLLFAGADDADLFLAGKSLRDLLDELAAAGVIEP
jgi:hypothetical protein